MLGDNSNHTRDAAYGQDIARSALIVPSLTTGHAAVPLRGASMGHSRNDDGTRRLIPSLETLAPGRPLLPGADKWVSGGTEALDRAIADVGLPPIRPYLRNVADHNAPAGSLTTVQTNVETGNDKINNIANTPSKPKDKPLSPLVLRFNQADRQVLDKLASDYGESIVSIVGKSIRLYRGIVDAAEQGGKLIMIKSSSPPKNNNNDPYETVIAVREQFADKDKTPIALNRAYINASKDLKTERLATRVLPTVIENLAELERKTGLSKSAILRDSMNLYNFIKRESTSPGTSFYIGDVLVDGI
jgi:hypothetical protein